MFSRGSFGRAPIAGFPLAGGNFVETGSGEARLILVAVLSGAWRFLHWGSRERAMRVESEHRTLLLAAERRSIGLRDRRTVIVRRGGRLP